MDRGEEPLSEPLLEPPLDIFVLRPTGVDRFTERLASCEGLEGCGTWAAAG